MAEPTFSSYTASDFTDAQTGGNETITISWSANDFIVIVAAGENNTATFGTPTGTGLTFLPIGAAQTSATDSWVAAWWAKPTASGSSVVVSSARGGTSVSGGMAAFVYSGADLGNWASVLGQAGTTIALARGTLDSGVVVILDDFSANTDVTVSASPASGGTQRTAVNAPARHTIFVFSWSGQGAAGEASFGISGASGNDHTGFAIEIRGTSGPAAPADRFLQAKLA